MPVVRVMNKPVEYEAIQFTGGEKNAIEVGEFIIRRYGGEGTIVHRNKIIKINVVDKQQLKFVDPEELEIAADKTHDHWHLSVGDWVVAENVGGIAYILNVHTDTTFKVRYNV